MSEEYADGGGEEEEGKDDRQVGEEVIVRTKLDVKAVAPEPEPTTSTEVLRQGIDCPLTVWRVAEDSGEGRCVAFDVSPPLGAGVPRSVPGGIPG